MIDTIRLILFLECNLNCAECCNDRKEIISRFKCKYLREIDFGKYKNVCITGGEPFLKKDLLYYTLKRIPDDKDIYIYTNGTLINQEDIIKLEGFPNIKCFNVGLHKISQMDDIDLDFLLYNNIRYMIKEGQEQFFFQNYSWITLKNTKTYKLNECDMPNEDWVLLEWD